jgi:outer membrane receptor for ferrienterochelin and colicins
MEKVTKGLTNLDFVFNTGLKWFRCYLYGCFKTENNITTKQIIDRKILCNWAISYRINKLFLDVDYTGNVYGPMRLPLLGDLDPGNIPQLGVFKTFNLRSINSRILKSMLEKLLN